MTPTKQSRVEHYFFINDHLDILIEILKKLDGKSLGVASCVCRLWCSISRYDSIWEHLCFPNHHYRPNRKLGSVVVALGGYKRLYMVCIRPVLTRLGGMRWLRRSSTEEVQLSLSLFCVDYYERLLGNASSNASSSSSLTFLYNNSKNINNTTNKFYPINV